eukprot:TRINITY_DN3372_c0_g1_i1.p3 TRINITY_DN3372_c0_g1~~TRINITY_DN3372_c0_g1_i1.p3  ORF type:complete len:122 (-),score=3.63 TRINITY_DN3372_c0_g1_i1:389-754(-)
MHECKQGKQQQVCPLFPNLKINYYFFLYSNKNNSKKEGKKIVSTSRHLKVYHNKHHHYYYYYSTTIFQNFQKKDMFNPTCLSVNSPSLLSLKVKMTSQLQTQYSIIVLQHFGTYSVNIDNA